MSKYSKRLIDLNEPRNLYTKLISQIGKNKKVLDFGCTSGFLAKTLRDQFSCKTWGLELDHDDAQKAKAFCEKVIECDLDTYKWKEELEEKAPFDVAIFADVLEHLKDPLSTLKKTKQLLSSSGYILISIPNIAHASARLELLSGSFEYEKIGIFDNTHLRFFTKKTVAELVEKAGFYIELIDSSSIDFSEEFLKEMLGKLNLKSNKELVQLLSTDEAKTVQYIIKATMEKPKGYKGWTFVKTLKPLNFYQSWIKDKDKILNLSQKENIERKEENLKLKKELDSIYQSRSWKTVQFLKRIKSVLFLGRGV